LNLKERFGRVAPVEVEIGFGNGEYLTRRAAASPDRDFLGIEIDWKGVIKTLGRIEARGAFNVRILHLDAKTAFERFLPPSSVHRVYSLFPLPWPKAKQVKHRLFSQSFLQTVNNRLVERGELHIVTDHEPYARWIALQAKGTGFHMELRRIPPSFDTKYERKWTAKGLDAFWELRFLKQRHMEVPLTEDVPMLHLRVEGFDPRHFHPEDERDGIILSFKEILFDPDRNKGMVRVVVSEESLTQNFWVEIQREGGSWMIRISQGSYAIPTEGVRRALMRIQEAAEASIRHWKRAVFRALRPSGRFRKSESRRKYRRDTLERAEKYRR